MARLVFIGEVFGSNDILSFILEINFLIQFVIQWNLHEPMPGTYDFEERLDVEAFIKMAQVIQFHFLMLALLMVYISILNYKNNFMFLQIPDWPIWAVYWTSRVETEDAQGVLLGFSN